MSYPKWVQRAPDIGAVLCANEAEEQKLLSDWGAELAAASQSGDEGTTDSDVDTSPKAPKAPKK